MIKDDEKVLIELLKEINNKREKKGKTIEIDEELLLSLLKRNNKDVLEKLLGDLKIPEKRKITAKAYLKACFSKDTSGLELKMMQSKMPISEGLKIVSLMFLPFLLLYVLVVFPSPILILILLLVIIGTIISIVTTPDDVNLKK